MNTATRKLLTIVTEAAIENVLLGELRQLEIHGCTITDARGFGSRGVRQGLWDGNSNIRIEVVCDHDAADRLAARLQTQYYENYAMILFVSDVVVLRPGKF